MDDLHLELALTEEFAVLARIPAIAAELERVSAAFESGVDELIQIATEALADGDRYNAIALLATCQVRQSPDKVAAIAAFALVRLAEHQREVPS